MKTSEKNICQSCGMPMRKMSDFGTYKDGSINTEYCFYCYQDGQFTDNEITLEEKMAKNIALAQKLGISKDKARKMARDILPKLHRWSKKRRESIKSEMENSE